MKQRQDPRESRPVFTVKSGRLLQMGSCSRFVLLGHIIRTIIRNQYGDVTYVLSLFNRLNDDSYAGDLVDYVRPFRVHHDMLSAHPQTLNCLDIILFYSFSIEVHAA